MGINYRGWGGLYFDTEILLYMDDMMVISALISRFWCEWVGMLGVGLYTYMTLIQGVAGTWACGCKIWLYIIIRVG